MLHITLFSDNKELCDCWKVDFADESNVNVSEIDYFDLPPHDSIVSPANSYGIMDGGLDLLIRNELGIHVQDNIQWSIIERYMGCQPIGTCIIVPTDFYRYFPDPNHVKKRFKYLAHAPTMQYPQSIENTLNPMHSFYAALIESMKFPDIKSLACSGMGAGTGMVPPNEVSKQMLNAYKLYVTKF